MAHATAAPRARRARSDRLSTVTWASVGAQPKPHPADAIRTGRFVTERIAARDVKQRLRRAVLGGGHGLIRDRLGKAEQVGTPVYSATTGDARGSRTLRFSDGGYFSTTRRARMPRSCSWLESRRRACRRLAI